MRLEKLRTMSYLRTEKRFTDWGGLGDGAQGEGGTGTGRPKKSNLGGKEGPIGL